MHMLLQDASDMPLTAPLFRPIDYEENRYVFGTHNVSEEPERTAVGRLDTGHHGCSLNIVGRYCMLPLSR